MSIATLPELRPIGALDNNLDHPDFNPTIDSPELNIAPLSFAADTTDTPVEGPNPRTISNIVSSGPNAEITDETASAWQYVFGQFVDHDLDLEKVGLTAFDIAVPDGDPEFGDGASIGLTRVITDPATGTSINTVAGFLDLSQIYGSDPATALSLRNADGTLKTSDGNYLQIVDATAPMGTPGAGITAKIYVSGDVRVNENPELAALSTMFVREHNYWAGQLAAQNPAWTGDQLYDMAKAITTAEYQNVVYSEFLPQLLGNVIPTYSGYDAKVDPRITTEFSDAAFRVGHSQVSGTQSGIDNSGNNTFSQNLAQAFFNDPIADQADGVDNLIRNLSSDFSQQTDVYAVDELRNLLAASPDEMDLIAIDIQRERDVGLSTFNETRAALGLTPYTSFAQFSADPAVQANLEIAYGSIDNVDLFIGGLAEDHVAGADVGETFQAIIGKQFTALRDGDRFFWENQAFDPIIKVIIANTTLGDIIERDTSTMVEQRNVFDAAQRHTSDTTADDPSKPQLIVGVNDDGAQISGGLADDTIVAGLGLNQILSGGGGTDVFVYDGEGYTDAITDFNNSDKLQYQPSVPQSLAEIMQTTTIIANDLNGDTVLNFGGNTVTLHGTATASLSAGNFLVQPGGPIDLIIDGNQLQPGLASAATS